MLSYFPFNEGFDPGMGMRVLTPQEALCEVEPRRYLEELSLKRRLLDSDPGYYFHGGPGTLPAQWDVVELVTSDLVRNYPRDFQLQREGDEWHWQNDLSREAGRFRFGDPSTLAIPPLDWIGRQVQEDLVLLSPGDNVEFVGGQLCFANGWAIGDRLGKSFLEIHQRTPRTTMPSVEMGARFLQKLKPGKTYWRTSWNFKLSDQMDMTSKHNDEYAADFARRAPRLTPENVGSAVYLRIERQTFTRLSRSGGLLFGIHTYNSLLAEEAADPGRARAILNVLRAAPSDVKGYKAITPIEGPMLAYLESRAVRN